MPERPIPLPALRRDPDLYRTLIDHATRGLRVQMLLRASLVIFVVGTVVAAAPARYSAVCYAIAGAYALWAVALGWLVRRGGERPVLLIWPALFVDLAALTSLSFLASRSEESWTADILLTGFLVIPMLATAQLRPGIAIGVTIPTVAVYLAASIAARHANGEPWASVALRTWVLVAVSVGCILLSWVQRSRVLTIARLATDRTTLATRLNNVEQIARRELAEELHDGALQYVLAARQDLEDARERPNPASFDRLDVALRESAGLLRAKVSQLHPAVLAQSGLLRALQDLARTTSGRGGLEISVSPDVPVDGTGTAGDPLLYGAARELVANIIRHSHARRAEITLDRDPDLTRLTVRDDGVGLPEEGVPDRVGDGHIGLGAQRLRIEAAGGRLMLRNGYPGTVAEIELPVSPSTDSKDP